MSFYAQLILYKICLFITIMLEWKQITRTISGLILVYGYNVTINFWRFHLLKNNLQHFYVHDYTGCAEIRSQIADPRHKGLFFYQIIRNFLD